MTKDQIRIEALRMQVRILHRWLYLEQNKSTVAGYLLKNNYSTIAIYGVGMIGRHLFEDLRKYPINIACLIDKRADGIFLNSDVDIITPDAPIPDVDLVIVTVTGFALIEVQQMLKAKTEAEVLSLLELLNII